jgi:tungstate transport system ATP-binding protein
MTGAPLLEIRDLKVKKGGATLLSVPSLQLAPGEVLSLVGPNGAGKSTLLLSLSGIEPPAAGQLLFRGKPVEGREANLAYRRSIAMAFQEPLLFDTTVLGNVAMGLRLRGLPAPEARRKALENLERFHIAHLAERSARTLSGGEAQRASLARALAVAPEILLLDEPFGSLDPPTREALLDDLELTLRATRTTTVFATHDRLEALRLADRLAVMNRGTIVQVGPPQAVMNRPADEFTATFLGAETILAARVTARDVGGTFTADVAGVEFEAVGDFFPGESILLCIRPENVTLSPACHRERTSARNVFPARIERIIHQGPLRKVYLFSSFPLTVYVTSHAEEELELRVGVDVTASVKATAIHVIRKGIGAR